MVGREAEGAGDDRTAASEVRHLTQAQLAQRLGVSQRTLEGWRYRGKGPAYLRLEGPSPTGSPTWNGLRSDAWQTGAGARSGEP